MHETTHLQDLIVLLQLLDHRGWVNTKYMPCMVLNKVDLTSFQLKIKGWKMADEAKLNAQ